MKKSRFDRSLEIYPPLFLHQLISNFQNSWESEFEVKKSCQDFRDSLKIYSLLFEMNSKLKESRFDWSFEIYLPLFFHINQFRIFKILDEKMNSKWKESRFDRSLEIYPSPPLFFHINQFRIFKIFKKVNSKWKNRDSIDCSKSTPFLPLFSH